MVRTVTSVDLSSSWVVWVFEIGRPDPTVVLGRRVHTVDDAVIPLLGVFGYRGPVPVRQEELARDVTVVRTRSDRRTPPLPRTPNELPWRWGRVTLLLAVTHTRGA